MKEIKIKDFKKIIISWNIVTPVDSYVDIEARVLVNNNLKENIIKTKMAMLQLTFRKKSRKRKKQLMLFYQLDLLMAQ